MNQIPFALIETWSADFVAERVDSARNYHDGGTSTSLTVLAAVASRLERMAAAVEGWARGKADTTSNPGHPAAAR
ncbi:MAG: hypothetical protein HY875_16060 [Chloroflexi bacterium]|nr:hypothetical protein [Chloroflexota bacterium]